MFTTFARYSSFPIYFIDKNVAKKAGGSDLSAHLQIKPYQNRRRSYTLINLKEPREEENDPELKSKDSISFAELHHVSLTKYRSVVLDGKGEKLLCFAVPKAISVDLFKTFEFPKNEVSLTEIVEGTMVSLFFDFEIGVWDIATKRAVGGNYRFYRQRHLEGQEEVKSFRKMFNEAFFPLLPKSRHRDGTLLDVSGLEERKMIPFPLDYIFTFVLQHPENHIVLEIEKPRVVVVAIYHRMREDEENVVVGIPYTEFRSWDLLAGFEFAREVPEGKFNNEDAAAIVEHYATASVPYTEVGVMLTHEKSGLRARVKNPAYLEVAELRGNHANMKFQYFLMRKQSKVQDFLAYFPQYQPLFKAFYEEFRLLVGEFYRNYVSFFVCKKNIDFPNRFMKVLFQIHQLYRARKKQNDRSFKITFEVVENHFDDMHPALLLSLLTEKRRFANQHTWKNP